MNIDLDAIRARAEAATPGPWRVNDEEEDNFCVTPTGRWVDGVMWAGKRADAELAAHAREDVPALLDALEGVSKTAGRMTSYAWKAEARARDFEDRYETSHASRMAAEAENDRLRTELDEVGQRSADRMVENHRLTDAIDAVRALDPIEVALGGLDAVTAALAEHLGGDQ